MPTARAILDRFLHHAKVIAVTGKSYRVKESPVVNETKKQRKSSESSTAAAAS
ncbi:MAG: ATP-binding protein [Limisphaerales bacterium]